MGIFKTLLGGGGADKAAEASLEASQTQAQYLNQALDYLIDAELIPREAREYALQGLMDYYKVPTEQLTQDQLIEQAMKSPLYQQIMGNQQAGEDSILRNASATGGLRSGGTSHNLARFNTDLKNSALLTSFNDAQARQDYERSLHLSGLTGLAGLPSNAPQIAGLYGDIGSTLAQGQVAAGQAKQQGTQSMFKNILGIAKIAAPFFSDIRLKKNIRHLGMIGRFNWFAWDWIPEAVKLGLTGTAQGFLAHEIFEECPNAVSTEQGFLVIHYDRIPMQEAA